MAVTVAPTSDFNACRDIRIAVFVEEQRIPMAEEFDAVDDIAQHLLATLDGTPVGTARVYEKGGLGYIGRICVLPSARGHKVGQKLVLAGLNVVRDMGLPSAQLSAQDHAIPFYERLGFVAYGDFYDDAGIPHKDMRRDL